MRTLELAVVDELRRQCMATQFRFCLDELDKLAGTCRSLARSPAGRTKRSSPYFKLANQLDGDVVRLRDLLDDGLDRTAKIAAIAEAKRFNRTKLTRDAGRSRRA